MLWVKDVSVEPPRSWRKGGECTGCRCERGEGGEGENEGGEKHDAWLMGGRRGRGLLDSCEK